MRLIGKTFQKLKNHRDGALVAYVTGGDPAPKYTPIIAQALIEGGADILEIGIPFSDPIADGPTIQAASVRALRAGTTPRKVLEIVREIKNQHNIPVGILTYYNPIFRMKLDRFFSLAYKCGVDGVIVPDLPIEEADEYRRVAESFGIDTIFLAAPSTSKERLRRIVECTTGFLYLVSHFGVTGEREKVEEETIQMIKRVIPFTTGRIPLAVGFGISKPDHARVVVENGAEGVIVGSAFVNIISENQGKMSKMLDEIKESARRIKEATIQNLGIHSKI